jgi:hypothetical protein
MAKKKKKRPEGDRNAQASRAEGSPGTQQVQ